MPVAAWIIVEGSAAGFEVALQELQRGHKESHWIWYIFPQVGGLGSSPMAQRYAISAEEAADYLRDPVFGPRLEQAAAVVAKQLDAGVRLVTLMGSSIDALKLVSSMTLFGRVGSLAAPGDPARFEAVAFLAERILRHASEQGFRPCAHTVRVLDGYDAGGHVKIPNASVGALRRPGFHFR